MVRIYDVLDACDLHIRAHNSDSFGGHRWNAAEHRCFVEGVSGLERRCVVPRCPIRQLVEASNSFVATTLPVISLPERTVAQSEDEPTVALLRGSRFVVSMPPRPTKPSIPRDRRIDRKIAVEPSRLRSEAYDTWRFSFRARKICFLDYPRAALTPATGNSFCRDSLK